MHGTARAASDRPASASPSLFPATRVRLAPDERQLRAAQVTLLYDSLPAGLLVSLICALALAMVQWEVVPHGVLLAWLVGMLAVSAGRGGLSAVGPGD